jgi:hypothetical protein
MRSPASIVVVGILFVAGGRALGEPTTAPSDAGPAQTLASLADALDKGDLSAVKSLYRPSTKSMSAEQWVAVSKAIKELNQAGVGRWEKETRPLLPTAADILRILPHIGTLQVDGDDAHLVRVDAQMEILASFKRVDQKWRLMSIGNNQPGADDNTMERYSEVIRGVTSDIEDGSFSSASDARRALAERLEQWGNSLR